MVLPASAGMILRFLSLMLFAESAPRIRGDDPSIASSYVTTIGCSPHPRG